MYAVIEVKTNKVVKKFYNLKQAELYAWSYKTDCIIKEIRN